MVNNNYSGKDLHFHHLREASPMPSSFTMHTHERYEIFLFLAGKASFMVEGTPYSLKPNDMMIFNSTEAHKIEVSPNEPYERVVIELNKNIFSEFDPNGELDKPFTSRPLGQCNKLCPTDFRDTSWKQYIMKIVDSDKNDIITIYSGLFSLLNEIRFAFSNQQSSIVLGSENTAVRIINYINANISGDITPESIAKEFYISRSQLYYIFKKSIGSSVWDYITTKRLFLAKQMMLTGEKPTDVYQKCGFKEYTAFFRAYKNKFGSSPKNDIKNK